MDSSACTRGHTKMQTGPADKLNKEGNADKLNKEGRRQVELWELIIRNIRVLNALEGIFYNRNRKLDVDLDFIMLTLILVSNYD